MDTLQETIFERTYARFDYNLGRREKLEEAVDRYCDFVLRDKNIPQKVKTKSRENIVALKAMPSMRALWTAGKALEEDNAVGYNCSYMPIDRLSAFGEALYLLMCGTGVGFSVEARHISKLPSIRYQQNVPVERHTIVDSRTGWKQALDLGVRMWFLGRDVYFDYSKLRPMGAPLRTMGGRSSGGDVLRQLLTYTREVIMGAQGRQLKSIEVHDILCETASVVVVGGTRRSALISISDLDDRDMRYAKQPGHHARRHGANNSAAYYERPSMREFIREWYSIHKSGRGERGIANIWAARNGSPSRRLSELIQGTNPCGEVQLRPRQFCNLTEVIIRASDRFADVIDKITTATWLGVVQSTLDYFPELSPEWTLNARAERLCGVSLTGQMDNIDLLTTEKLDLYVEHYKSVAYHASQLLGINMPAAIGSVKPSGTVSQLVGCSAGLHPRWSDYYIRNIQISVTDPLFMMLADQGVPWRITPGSEQTAIISFPVASPKGAITRHDLSAIDQLEWYLKLTEHWCEHSASCTVYIDEDEWLDVGKWVWDHLEQIKGVSFLPKDGGTYDWLPYQECTEREYEEARAKFPEVDFSKLSDYESEDMTEGAKEFACTAGGCEL